MDYARVAKDTELKNATISDDGSSNGDSRRKRSLGYSSFEQFHSRVVSFLKRSDNRLKFKMLIFQHSIKNFLTL